MKSNPIASEREASLKRLQRARDLDISSNAAAPELICALAEKPCPICKGVGEVMVSALRGYELEPPEPVTCSICQGLGLANPWASETCSGGLGCLDCVSKPEPLVHDAFIYARGRICNGSGRVPKAVGLEELLTMDTWELENTEDKGWEVWYYPASGHWFLGEGELPLLAALRAVVKAQMKEFQDEA